MESGRYKAGDAYVGDIKPYNEHNHIAETPNGAEIIGVYVNIAPGDSAQARAPRAGQLREVDAVELLARDRDRGRGMFLGAGFPRAGFPRAEFPGAGLRG